MGIRSNLVEKGPLSIFSNRINIENIEKADGIP